MINVLREPYQISSRFFLAMQVKALSLEANALHDELLSASITNMDQLRRQRLLIQAQRDEAERLRDFLKYTSIRQTEGLPEATG
jgi:hypothetical protein